MPLPEIGSRHAKQPDLEPAGRQPCQRRDPADDADILEHRRDRFLGGNGQSDILFHNASGQNLIWVVQNDQLVGGYSLPQTPTSWSVAGVGDFTGSGTDGTLH